MCHYIAQDYVKELVDRMKRYRGVYTSHAHRLRSLMHDLQVRYLYLLHGITGSAPSSVQPHSLVLKALYLKQLVRREYLIMRISTLR